MANIRFDTHQFVTTLQNAGFEQKQAEGAFRETQEQADPVTRHDLKALELSLKTEIQSLRSDMQTLEYRMTFPVTLVAVLIKRMEHT